jgi:hypothetical protein
MIKRSIVTVLSLVVILWLAGASAWAQGKSGSHPGGTGGTGMSRGSSPSGNSASSNSSSERGSNASINSSPGDVLSRNTSLSGALTTALGKSGITVPGGNLATFCSSNSFKTLGQCIAALHINHKFPTCTFTDLSAKPLGQAIQGCAPHASAKVEARNATKQANADIKGSESESGSSRKGS